MLNVISSLLSNAIRSHFKTFLIGATAILLAVLGRVVASNQANTNNNGTNENYTSVIVASHNCSHAIAHIAVAKKTDSFSQDTWLLRKHRRQGTTDYRDQLIEPDSQAYIITDLINIPQLNPPLIRLRGFIVKLHDTHTFLHLFHLF